MTDWIERAAQLAEELAASGKLRSSRWKAAVRAVPRHELVPVFFGQTPTGEWLAVDTATPKGFELVYSNSALYTKVGELSGSWGRGQVGLSSSSMPGLMIRMLEALDIRDGDRVLEIGTGTGYNAALLSHRLGDERVFSVDVDADLVELARERLARIGYHPTLVAVDGENGLPEHAPYDRIIATCSVPAIPWPWVEQIREGGLILSDVNRSTHAGHLVLRTRRVERAEGSFQPVSAGFMSIRHHGAERDRALPERNAATARQRTTSVDYLRPWDNLVVWFLAGLAMPLDLTYGHTIDEATGASGDLFLSATDGSWCEVTERLDNGARRVLEGGPRQLWRAVEEAYRLWCALGQPGWERFGLTVTRECQWVWLDQPGGAHTWPLTADG